MEIKWTHLVTFKWFKRLYILYIYGFVAHFRPSSPFIYEFFTKYKHFSENAVLEDIFPIFFYSSAVTLVPVFLITDIIRYNPLIILSSLAGIVAICLRIWTDSIAEIQVAMAFQGSMIATEIAYYVAIYANGDLKYYQKLTAYVRAAPLAGKLVSSFTAQLIVSQDWLDYKQLHYFDLSSAIIATILCIFLPPIFKSPKNPPEKPDLSNLPAPLSKFLRCFPNKLSVKWSIWTILTLSIFTQTSIFIQPMWRNLQETKNLAPYNGAVDGVYAIFALVGTLLGGYAQFDWKFKGDLILSMTSLVQAFMLLFVALLENVLLNHLFYAIFGFMYHFVVTIICGEMAKFLENGSFGLFFGFVGLVAAGLGSGMVCLLNDEVGYHLVPQDLFMVYGFFDLGVSVLFIALGLGYWFAKHTYPV